MPTGDPPERCNCCCHKPISFEAIVEKNPQWEYMIDYGSYDLPTRFNELGQMGWEIYAHRVIGGQTVSYLKRKL